MICQALSFMYKEIEMSDNIKDFNKTLKEKLEDTFGKEYVNNKIIIMGLDDDDKGDNNET